MTSTDPSGWFVLVLDVGGCSGQVKGGDNHGGDLAVRELALNGQDGGAGKATTVPVQRALDEAPAIDAMTASVASAQPELLDYPVPLVDSQVTAILRLPRNYTTGDATRMTALINALAIPLNTGSLSPTSDA